jgi:hypothetical protein
MTAAPLILLALYIALSAWIAVRADRRFSRHATLPMQWGLDRRPTWSLPRRPALVVIAVLSGVPLLASVLLSLAPSIPSDLSGLSRGQTLAVLAGMAALGLAVLAFYLWLLALWDRATA